MYKIEFTLDELNLVLKGLKKLPAKEVSKLLNNIVNQYKESIRKNNLDAR